MRAHDLLTGRLGFAPEDIIFDPNIFAVATGIDEHNRYGLDFIEATAEIKRRLPGVMVSGGVSNVSFSFRGNERVREAMHSVFLYHAIRAGLSMGIVNAGQLAIYEDIPAELRERVEDVILARRADATERLLEIAERFKGDGAVRRGDDLESVSYTHLDVYKRQPSRRSSRPFTATICSRARMSSAPTRSTPMPRRRRITASRIS